MKNKLKKYWPEITAFAVWLGPQLIPIAQSYVNSHPLLDHRIAWLAVILARLAQSPLGKKA